MKLMLLIAGELAAMFVDDEFLAVAILGLVGIAALLVWLVPGLAAGVFLLGGCVAIVLISVARASRRKL